jgi:hypothetical protein
MKQRGFVFKRLKDYARSVLKPVAYYQFEKRVLRRIFGPKRGEVTGEWRKVHNEEFNDLYSSPNIARMITSRIMKWEGHVTRMGEKDAYTGFWWVNLLERDHCGDIGVDGRIILRWIFSKWDVGL